MSPGRILKGRIGRSEILLADRLDLNEATSYEPMMRKDVGECLGGVATALIGRWSGWSRLGKHKRRDRWQVRTFMGD